MKLTSGEVHAVAQRLVTGWHDLPPEQRLALRHELATSRTPDVAASLREAARLLSDLRPNHDERGPS